MFLRDVSAAIPSWVSRGQKAPNALEASPAFFSIKLPGEFIKAKADGEPGVHFHLNG